MKLFKFDSYKVNISEEALAIKAFRELWNRDKSFDKSQAFLELGYVYFMCDPRSDYMVVADEDERSALIIEQEGLGAKWKPDAKVKQAMEIYLGFKPQSALLLEDIKLAVKKLRETLTSIDLLEKDASGKPVFKANEYANTLERLLKLCSALKEAERQMAMDMAESGRARGGGQKTVFEDELSID